MSNLNDYLIKASSERHTDVVKVLLEAGANVKLKDDKGYTVLMLAVRNGHLDLAEKIIKHYRKTL
jgi:ankyrin repeat protein